MLRDTVTSGIQFKQNSTTGVLTFWDVSRCMYIGVDRENYEFGINHKNISSNIWMSTAANINTLANGILIQRNCLITCISVNSSNLTDCDFDILVNNISIQTISLSNENKKILDYLSVNININDLVSVICKPLNNKKIDYPSLIIEMAWR